MLNRNEDIIATRQLQPRLQYFASSTATSTPRLSRLYARRADAAQGVAPVSLRHTDDGKRIINGHTDVNQPVPFKCKWARKKYLASCAGHRMPQEVSMTRDSVLSTNASMFKSYLRHIANRRRAVLGLTSVGPRSSALPFIQSHSL